MFILCNVWILIEINIFLKRILMQREQTCAYVFLKCVYQWDVPVTIKAITIMYLVFVDIAVFDMRCYHNLENKYKERHKLKYLKLIVEPTYIGWLSENRQANLNHFQLSMNTTCIIGKKINKRTKVSILSLEYIQCYSFSRASLFKFVTCI